MRSLLELLKSFDLQGEPLRCAPYGNGHINRTWLVETAVGKRYILQRINDRVFPDVPLLMRNIAAVTDYLHAQGLDERHALTLLRTREGALWHHCSEGGAEMAGDYRVYAFVEDSICLESAQTQADLRQSGRAFGQFQQALKDFPADTLGEVIPGFHNTVKRFEQLEDSIKRDAVKCAASVAREIDFARERRTWAGSMLDLQSSGLLPLRVTHNDTKLNNVLLDAKNREPLCVIDLDTVMPGLAGNDFGDSIRFGASTAAEDERDLDKVEMSMALFQAYAQGFLAGCGSSLTQTELETLPLGAMLMTYECGIRFLADHLAGDVYFRIHRPNQNLDRARTQFKLVADMERKQDEMRKTIRALAAQMNVQGT